MLWGVVLCFAAGLTLALTPLAGRLGRRWGLVDVPGGRRRHQGIVPRTGGLALFGGFFVTVLLLLLLPAWEVTAPWFPARNDPHEERRLAALLVGSLYCVVFGLLDDRIGLKSGPQYLIQFGAALIACGGLIFVKHVNNPFGEGLLWGPDGFPGWLVFLLTTFWFMGMMNTINFLDGASGLVAGVTAVLAAVLALHMIFKAEPPQQSVALLPVAGVGTVLSLGLLTWAWAWARQRESLPGLQRLAQIPLPSALASRSLRWLARLHLVRSRWLRPRLQPLQGSAWRWPWALWVACMAFIIFLPVPFGNVLPAASLVIFSLGLMARDGLWQLLSLVPGVGGLAVIGLSVHTLLALAARWPAWLDSVWR